MTIRYEICIFFKKIKEREYNSSQKCVKIITLSICAVYFKIAKKKSFKWKLKLKNVNVETKKEIESIIFVIIHNYYNYW